MSDKKKVILIRNDYSMEVEIVSIFRVHDIEYVVYSVDITDELCDIYVGRIGKDASGKDIIINIDNEFEKKNMHSLVDKILKKSRGMK